MVGPYLHVIVLILLLLSSWPLCFLIDYVYLKPKFQCQPFLLISHRCCVIVSFTLFPYWSHLSRNNTKLQNKTKQKHQLFLLFLRWCLIIVSFASLSCYSQLSRDRTPTVKTHITGTSIFASSFMLLSSNRCPRLFFLLTLYSPSLPLIIHSSSFSTFLSFQLIIFSYFLPLQLFFYPHTSPFLL